ncbi:hypothetical protein DX902_19710 [Paenibacillus jamilae]|nr:hypothetical protein DX902_19710 [Paenibacillus jamilae]
MKLMSLISCYRQHKEVYLRTHGVSSCRHGMDDEDKYFAVSFRFPLIIQHDILKEVERQPYIQSMLISKM